MRFPAAPPAGDRARSVVSPRNPHWTGVEPLL